MAATLGLPQKLDMQDMPPQLQAMRSCTARASLNGGIAMYATAKLTYGNRLPATVWTGCGRVILMMTSNHMIGESTDE